MLRRQRVDGRYVVEEIPMHSLTVVLGVELDGTRYDRVGERFRIEGFGTYQLECPSEPHKELRFVPHTENNNEEVIEMAPERANVLAVDGRLEALD